MSFYPAQAAGDERELQVWSQAFCPRVAAGPYWRNYPLVRIWCENAEIFFQFFTYSKCIQRALHQRGAQLTKVPLFEVLKFRWGFTSSTRNPVKIYSDWSVFINMPGQARPKGRRPEFWLRSQTLAFWVEEVDPQRNFRASKRGTLDNCAHLCSPPAPRSCWLALTWLQLRDGESLKQWGPSAHWPSSTLALSSLLWPVSQVPPWRTSTWRPVGLNWTKHSQNFQFMF